MNKSAIFITFDGLSDPLGQSQILPYVIGLARQGIHMRIISCEKRKRIGSREKSILKTLQTHNIAWRFLIYEETGGFFSRWSYIRQLIHLTSSEIDHQMPALIHCRSYLAALIGLKFKKTKNIPFIFDMRGFWADERMEGGIWSAKNPVHRLFYWYFKKKEKQFIHQSAAIVSLTENGKNELLKMFIAPELSQKITVIPCCVDTSLFDPEKTHAATLPGLKPDSKLLVYSGSIGTWYCTREMIDCAALWRKKIPALQLLVLTRDHDEIKALISGMNLPSDLILVQGCERQEVPFYLRLAEAAIFFIRPVFSKIASSPTKMAECWSMDLPVITNAGIGDNDLFFRDGQGGVLIRHFSDNDYAQALNEYLNIPKNTGIYRRLAIKGFDLKNGIEKYQSIYDRLIK